MSQADLNVANQSGAAFRADLNTQLLALGTLQSGASEPGTTYAYMLWADSANGLLKQRNAANNGWVSLGSLVTTNLGMLPIAGGTMTGALGVTAGTENAPGVFFSGDTNTGVYSPGADTLALVTANTNRLHITSAGLVGIGTTGPTSALTVNGSISTIEKQTAVIGVDIATTSGNGGDLTVKAGSGSGSGNSSGKLYLGYGRGNSSADSGFLAFGQAQATNINGLSSEAARIDSSGRLLVGTSSARTNFFNSSLSAALQLEGTGNARRMSIVGNDAQPIVILAREKSGSVGGNTVVANGDVLGLVSFQGSDGTDFVSGAEIYCEVDGTPGANDMPGRLVFSTTADGAASPTERMRISNQGDIRIGTASQIQSANLSIQPYSTSSNGIGINVSAPTGFTGMVIDRTASDGDLITFLQAGATEGVISVSGTTVTYGGGHLARWSQLPNNEDPSGILKGTVMSNLDEICEWDGEDNEQLNKTKVSDVEGDPDVAGVFVSTSFSDDGPLDFFVAMTGDMIIRIAEGVTVERGDLLMSAGDGTAKPQDDDIIRSKTVAKVTSTHVACTYEDGSYCVPCVLMACQSQQSPSLKA